jgi:exonuclease V gamma subunit
LQGQSRPICYAPETSDAYAKAVEDWGDAPDETALEKASDEWNREPSKHNNSAGEGCSPGAQIAWRDQDPFAQQEAWHQWARNIARPLRAWFKPD